ncbi:hypothetical protein [Vibrio mediterranei]|uniref:hypothetical protein n=1 Tax=Vibrio mediterranei TaxID=689 RepID=UPI0040680A20
MHPIIKRATLLTFCLGSAVQVSAQDFYKVTVVADKSERETIIHEITLALGEPVTFSSEEQYQYVSGHASVEKWYHRLFGLNPPLKLMKAEVGVGIRGEVLVSRMGEDIYTLEFDGKLTEQVSTDTSQFARFELPALRSFYINTSEVFNLQEGSDCIEHKKPGTGYTVSICLTGS